MSALEGECLQVGKLFTLLLFVYLIYILAVLLLPVYLFILLDTDVVPKFLFIR